MCRYIPIDACPPRATPEQAATLKKASELKAFMIMGLAKRYVEYSWRIKQSTFFEAVHDHIKNEYFIFQKYDPTANGVILPNKLQANVILFEDEDEAEGDVYVEFTLTGNTVVLIIDSHKHPLNKPRYPRN